MLCKAVLTLLILEVSLPLFASSDTLVYRSTFEEKIVRQAIVTGDVDLLALYSVITTDSAEITSFSEKLNLFYSFLDPKMIAVKSPKQKARLVFKQVHDHFLKQYEEHTSFNSIFDDGRYNCVTGSMLYVIVLNRYGIPYAIKEKPTHVYVVAYPSAENIMFETTNPKGFYVPDEKTKKAYVDALISQKFASAEHVQKVGYAKAFNEFFYNSDNITEIQLAALQYSNYALANYQAEQYDAAVSNVLKTNLLFPSPKYQYLSLEIIGSALQNSTFDNIQDVMYICEYANACRDVADRRNAVAIFARIVKERLIENDDEKFLLEAFAICKEKIRDSAVVRDISYDYYYAMAYSATVKADTEMALKFAKRAHEINPRNVNVHDLILRAIMVNLGHLRDKEIVSTIEGYAVTFPFLESNRSYKSLLIYAYAHQSYLAFSKNNEDEGYAFMRKTEAAMKTDWNKLPMMDEYIGLMYAEAGAYHFRKRQYTKAKAILRAGLEIIPNHAEIKARLEIVENEEMRPTEAYLKDRSH